MQQLVSGSALPWCIRHCCQLSGMSPIRRGGGMPSGYIGSGEIPDMQSEPSARVYSQTGGASDPRSHRWDFSRPRPGSSSRCACPKRIASPPKVPRASNADRFNPCAVDRCYSNWAIHYSRSLQCGALGAAHSTPCWIMCSECRNGLKQRACLWTRVRTSRRAPQFLRSQLTANAHRATDADAHIV